jgi:hypothetical protein
VLKREKNRNRETKISPVKRRVQRLVNGNREGRELVSVLLRGKFGLSDDLECLLDLKDNLKDCMVGGTLAWQT